MDRFPDWERWWCAVTAPGEVPGTRTTADSLVRQRDRFLDVTGTYLAEIRHQNPVHFGGNGTKLNERDGRDVF
ncbi:hypothetical protein AB0M48_33140 [Lentzea sp. NPDC051208]|uniref:hypothetical protein n=1 Tax=Lentzea sp. NPDC051208 TaxID=3154642 RepID=UPI003417710E